VRGSTTDHRVVVVRSGASFRGLRQFAEVEYRSEPDIRLPELCEGMKERDEHDTVGARKQMTGPNGPGRISEPCAERLRAHLSLERSRSRGTWTETRKTLNMRLRHALMQDARVSSHPGWTNTRPLAGLLQWQRLSHRARKINAQPKGRSPRSGRHGMAQ
jgi:hypothetical protein